MQDIPCIGRVVDGRVTLDCNIILNDDARCDVSESFYEVIRFGRIEIEGSDKEKLHVDKMINRIVKKVDNPQLSDNIDLSHCQSWEDALAELQERNEMILAYRDYVEKCNSLRLLFNVLNPLVKDYLQKKWMIAGTGHSVGFYDNITKYYAELKVCRNRVKKNRCNKIIVSVEDGLITEVIIVNTQRKRKTIPILAKGSKDKSFLDLGISVQTSFIDKKHQWENVKKAIYIYELDSEDCYSFEEIRNSVQNYLDSLLKYKVTKRIPIAEELCKNLESLYRYLMDVLSLSRNDSWEFICKLWQSEHEIMNLYSEDERELMWRYLGNYKDLIPLKFKVNR